MGWFNHIGLIIVILMILPNILYAIFNKEQEEKMHHPKALVIIENIGRYGSMFFMIFNIPYTWIQFYIPNAILVYIIFNSALLASYIITFLLLMKRKGIVKNLILSVLPSMIFLFSSVMIASIPLFLTAVLFFVGHVAISCRAGKTEDTHFTPMKPVLTSIILALSMSSVLTFAYIAPIMVQASNLSKLETMNASTMIDYDAGGNAKISYALIQDGTIKIEIADEKGRRAYNDVNEISNNFLYDYEIGSCSKTYVGLLFSKLFHEGKASPSDSISKYLDLDKNRYYPTLERLLTHTSGYDGDYFEFEMVVNRYAQISGNDYRGITKDKILAKAKSVLLEDKDYPFVYSNFGISVLGLVLESIYQDTFTNIMNHYIKTDLNLNSSAICKENSNLEGGWKWNVDDGYLPVGAIISNLKDMVNYLNIYLNNALPYASLSYQTNKKVDANFSTYQSLGIRIDSMGYTWCHNDSNKYYWHNGGTSSYNSFIAFSDDLKKGVVVLSNLGPEEGIPMTVIGSRLMMEEA